MLLLDYIKRVLCIAYIINTNAFLFFNWKKTRRDQMKIIYMLYLIQHGLSWEVGLNSWYTRESAFELKNCLLIHIVTASSHNLRDLRKNNLALRYGLPMPTSCKNYEKTDSAPLNNKQVENFHLHFFIFLFTNFQISFDYDEVLAKIYNMQKKETKYIV